MLPTTVLLLGVVSGATPPAQRLARWRASSIFAGQHTVATAEEQSERLSHYCGGGTVFPALCSRTQANNAAQRGDLLLNGNAVHGAVRVNSGDILTLQTPAAPPLSGGEMRRGSLRKDLRSQVRLAQFHDRVAEEKLCGTHDRSTILPREGKGAAVAKVEYSTKSSTAAREIGERHRRALLLLPASGCSSLGASAAVLSTLLPFAAEGLEEVADVSENEQVRGHPRPLDVDDDVRQRFIFKHRDEPTRPKQRACIANSFLGGASMRGCGGGPGWSRQLLLCWQLL